MEERRTILSNYINENIYEIPTILNEKISQDNKKYQYRKEFHYLKVHINNFLNNVEDERFLVLPGIRGVGKTTLLFQVYEYILKEKAIPFNQVLYVSCDDLNDLTECSIRELTEIYLKNYHNTNIRMLDKKIFLLIDEAQYDKNWALSGKIIYDKNTNIFMIFSGSSALHLEYNANSARRSFTYEIRPVNFLHHVRLKYNISMDYNPELLTNMLFTGNIEKCLQKESELNNMLMRNLDYNSMEWDNYLFYGGYPIYFTEKNFRKIRNKIVKMTKKVVETDLPNIKNISEKNRTNANRILRYLALIESSDVSQNNLSNYLNTASGNVEKVMDLLEKTHLIFHLESYGTSSNRSKKSWKYYFATSSIKYSLASYIGNSSKDKNKYEGILLENVVASKLYELSDNNYNFSLYYDAGKKSNVDFIIENDFEDNVAIEVGRGKKDKKQVINAMNHYNSQYGIIISNRTTKIEKEDDIIYIPPKTFALL